MGGDGVADAASVFVECEVTAIVQAVFYRPVSTDELGKSFFIGLLGQEAGDAVCDFVSFGTIRQGDFALHGEDLSGVREVDLLGFNALGNQAA